MMILHLVFTVRMTIFIRSLSLSNINFNTVAYFTGYIVFGIIQLVIEILLTGGSATVARLFKTGADVMTKTVKGVMRFGDNLLDVLRGFIRLFEKGVDEVIAFFKKIIDDFFDWLEDMFKKGKADEVLEKPTINLIQAQKMWKEFRYTDFFAKPPQKPCFLAGTIISTTNGFVPIEKIKTGTEVYCYDEIKQEITTQKVSETFKNQADKYLVITTQSGEKLNVTGQHLFYQKTSKTWIKAHQLKVGMKLYNAQNDILDTIIELQIIERQETTYNFEVPVHHNYLVGKTGVLVHNASKFKSVDDVTTRKYAFYQLLTLDDNLQGSTQYIGKTTREDLYIRGSEHKYSAKKKGKGSKHYWKFELEPQIANLNKGDLRYVEMTSIQSDVWEKYYLEKYRYDTGKPLRNIQNPISEKRFNALKSSKNHLNICMFFV